MKKAIKLWSELASCDFCCQQGRDEANIVCEELDIIKKYRPFIFYISSILSKLIIVKS